MMSPGRDDWSFATSREPTRFGLARHDSAADHAHRMPGTLCGLPERRIEVYLTHFDPHSETACPTCRRLAEAAPTRPSAQERLHDQIKTAEASPVRTDLRAALRRGTPVNLWITGPAADLAKHYAALDRLTEGRAAVAAALAVTGSITLATVRDTTWHYTVVLPDSTPPTLGRGPAPSRTNP